MALRALLVLLVQLGLSAALYADESKPRSRWQFESYVEYPFVGISQLHETAKNKIASNFSTYTYPGFTTVSGKVTSSPQTLGFGIGIGRRLSERWSLFLNLGAEELDHAYEADHLQKGSYYGYAGEVTRIWTQPRVRSIRIFPIQLQGRFRIRGAKPFIWIFGDAGVYPTALNEVYKSSWDTKSNSVNGTWARTTEYRLFGVGDGFSLGFRTGWPLSRKVTLTFETGLRASGVARLKGRWRAWEESTGDFTSRPDSSGDAIFGEFINSDGRAYFRPYEQADVDNPAYSIEPAPLGHSALDCLLALEFAP